ncbi:MAG: LamG-like jellyroll fold domain-containing protein [Armatimonadota bacterium]
MNLPCRSLLSIFILCAAATLGPAQQTSTRTPVLSPPLVFSSSQVKYGLYQNYLHRYLDRPLLMDRSTRGREVLTEASFHKIMGHAKMYGLDGLSILIGTPGMVDRYERALKAADSSGRDDFVIMPRLGTSRDITYLDRTLKAALASSHSLRVNGKLLCGGYSTGLPPADVAVMLKDLRAIHGDSFLFCPDLGRAWGSAMEERRTTGKIDPATIDGVRATLRSYLDVCDGMFLSPSMLRAPDRTLDIAFYRGTVLPVITGVMSEAPHRGKFLGLAADTGYFNFMTGSTLDESGTKTLRQSFEAAMSAPADFIDMPEWDELNEHTCIQPTITNSFSTQRIIKYYTSVLRKQAPQPNAGDDVTIPNLVVSYRKALTLGEPLQIELLNVPDGTQQKPYRVQVTLLNAAGEVVKALPAVELAPDKLMDATPAIPSETLPGTLILRPRVTVTTAEGREVRFDDGLMHVTLRPTDNFDYKWVRQPLRDIIRPTTARFEVKPYGDGTACRVSGALACGEPLAFLEVVENGDEVHGVDVTNEYPDREQFMLLDITMRAMRDHRPFTARIELENTQPKFHTQTDGRYYFNRGNALDINNFSLSVWPRGGMVSFPRADADKAVLVITSNLFNHRVPVAKVLRLGRHSETLDDGITVTLEDFRREPDITPHIGKSSADFHFTMRPRRPNSLVWMRGLTQSGKIYRSAPVLLGALPQGQPTPLDIFSDTNDRPCQVSVDSATIPDLKYEFNPENGSLLYTAAGQSFWGQLGGRGIDATGVGGGEAGGMGDPYRSGGAYPKNAKQSAPRYVTEDGRQVLQFDGVGNYVVFPREMTPRRGSWTLEFELKPTSAKKQVLFSHHGHYTGSVTVYLENGVISSEYSDRYLTTTQQRPGLKLPLNEWSTVRISYNLSAMTYTVNGQTSKPLPAPGPGLYLGASVFGGLGDGMEYFEGGLRSLRMVHRAL